MKTRRLFFKRILPLMMVAVMAFTSVPANIISRVTGSNVADMASVSAATDYGLCDNIQDGVILHCFDWKYTDIEAELPNIAEAGFTSIQTSPAQRNDSGASQPWYWLYQPQNFAITTNPLGTKAELESLCKKAHEYGIKIVVDVVANHTRGSEGENGNIDSSLKRREFFRYGNKDSGPAVDWKNRYDVYTCNIGMRDLVSENTDLQKIIAGYITELQNAGVDGIRWDAAKHIQLPSEGNCQFWPTVTSQGLWHYGEILDGPNNGGNNNDNLMKEYTNYISVTDDVYGDQVLEGPKDQWGNRTGEYGFNSGKIPTTIGNYSERIKLKNKLVYWAESHDTYANDGDYGSNTSLVGQNVVDRAYAVLASQGKATALYFSRPYKTRKAEIMPGVKGSTHFTSEEVAAVNHLHNACVGEPDYYVADTNNNVAAVCRTSGAAVVLGSGSDRDVTVANGGSTVKPGTYTDQISGSTWTVTSTTMSGHVGNTGIAVFYEAEPIVKTPTPTISKEGGNFSDTLTLTIGLKNATEGTYKIGDASAEKYTASKDIIIGNDMSFGDSVTVTLTATDGSQTETKTYTFTKVEQTGNVVYLDLPSGWNTPVYCYAFAHGVTPAQNNAAWPGVKMTLDEASGYYKYEIPDTIENPEVILHDDTDDNRTSPDQQPGKVIDGSWLYKDGSWSEYSSPRPQPDKGTVTVKYVDESGKEIAAAKTLTGNVGSSYETSAATVSGYILMGIPSNATGKYTKDPITVTYKYTKNGNNETPTVTSSLAEGSSFKTETAKITLTLQNAESGTYSVDDGPVRTFTGSAEVVIGQGKVADSTITVKATAKSGTETKDYTFTYKKQFDKTVDETVKALQANTAGSTLASQYKTNAVGKGVNKTISVDGDLSDWDSSMLIAQGAANDDPRVYRPGSMYELPIDLYALYGAYDDNNVYLMWEMTNVQDVVAPNDDYPLSQGILWQTLDCPFHIAIDTGKGDVIGNKGLAADGKSHWNSRMTIENRFNRMVSCSYKGFVRNDPCVYKGTSGGLDVVAAYNASGVADTGETIGKTGIKIEYGKGIISNSVKGIDGAYGEYHNRVVGDIYDDSAAWVDFNEKGHSSATMDFFYEMSIPYEELGITKSDVTQNGIGVLLVATMGSSGLDCLPYDASMNDQADLEDTESQPENSFEKSDEDHITCSFARIGNGSNPNPDPVPDPDPVPTPDPTPDSLELNFGADRSSPQAAATALSLEGIAKGGTAPYTYKFYVNDKLVDEKKGNGEVSVNWTPAAGNNQIIKCQVEDSKGNTTQSAKFYTIEGKVEDCIHSNTTVKAKKEATCTEAGHEEETVCADCGEVIVPGEIIPAKGHTWSSGVCTVCGAEQPVDCNHNNTTVQGKKEATCTEAGHEGNTVCTDCGEVLVQGSIIPAKGHNWVSGVCIVCGVKQDDVTIDVTVLDTDIVYDGKAKTPQVIVKAGKELLTKDVDYTVSYRNNTNAGEALVVVTCKGNYTGTIEKTFTIAKATGPESGIPGTKKNAPKTAEKVSDIELPAGWKWSEEDTGKKLETGVTVTATAVYEGADKNNFETVRVSVQITKSDCEHPYNKVKIKDDRAVGCTEPGYTGDKYCEECGEIVENGTEIKAIGHLWGDGRVTKQPTATETGVMTYRCTRCTATKTEEIPSIGSCQHTSTELRNVKAATCTEKGYSGDSYCKACGDLVKKGNDIPATGHSWDAGKVTKAPTATAKGVKTYTCTKCHNTRTEEIPATGGSSISQPYVITVPGNVEKGDSVEDTATNSVYMVTSKSLTSKTVKYVVTGSEKDTLVVPDSISINGEVYKVTAVASDAFKGNDTAKKIVVGDNVKTIGANAFSNCKNLSQVTLGKNVTTIGANAFSNCNKMTKITLGKNVTTIGKNAFGGCTMLSSVTLPSKLSKIEEKAFYKCTKLKSITIPAKVKKIGKKAFYGCKNLKKITIKTTKLTKKNVGSNAFKGINSKATIKVPKKKLKSYKQMLRAKGVGSKAKIKK
ncbi:MAG: leucine-rich repeat protein [Lachnospiraceae bacterium]|nr:leucine-rich repeat protein [Lachnospiraceae bacterium]